MRKKNTSPNKNSLRMRKVSAFLASCLLLTLLSCSSPAPRSVAGPLVDILSVTALESRFNTDRGSPRVILLVSPT